MNSPAPASDESRETNSSRRRQLLILIIISGAILLFIAVVILVYLGLRGAGQGAEATPTPTERIEPTLTVPTQVSPVPVPSCETIISSGDAQVSVALPLSLTVGGTVYPVEPIVPQADAWVYPEDRSGPAVWVCGTIINYVIGLQPTPANQDLIGNLAPGSDVTLQLTSGAVLHFRFTERRDLAPGADEALSQQQPRLTVVLPGAESWQVAFADYAAEAESVVPPPSGVTGEVGQPVDLGQARVTVSRGYVERHADLAPATAYYLVAFSVENVGDSPLPTDAFSMELRDSIGNVYLLSAAASGLGEAGPLSGEIQPGASAQGTAGYVVPDPLPAGELTWIFSPRPATTAARVVIPHEGGGPDQVPAQPEVVLVDAFLGDAGNTLIIEGEVWNRGTEPLVVEAADIRLSSSAGMSERSSEAPPLPWTIEPGERRVVELQYPKPDASSVLLELLGYSFEIGGLN